MAEGWAHLLNRGIAAGVVDQETASRIREFELAHDGSKRLRWPILIALTFGALALGAGVLLFVSANWDNLSPDSRFGVVTLRAENERLVATTPVSGPAAVTARLIERWGERVAVLNEPLAFFISEHVADPSRRPASEELWVEVTIPRAGRPRTDPARREEGRPADPARGELMDNCARMRRPAGVVAPCSNQLHEEALPRFCPVCAVPASSSQ